MRKTSMIPKSGNRFSDKIMRKAKNLSRNPIQLNRIEVQSDQSPGYLADVITAPQISPQA